ncbi:hypothetical protein JTE90_010513 [Oedothorax gibbosus]|uniref:Uncharacterized protein n=1 Tax=Oedothorax gibbosus TaxID=931172 RepID=A0AAV6VZX5_9ARAC|nr:hypothetical protein JTE90_010513 [Oedothorax gibbosus]
MKVRENFLIQTFVTMKFLYLAVLAVMIALTQASSFAPLAVLSLTLFGLHEPVAGFFGLFRRRSTFPSVVEQQATAPQGPVQIQNPTFPQRGSSFFNPFPGGMAQGFMNMAGGNRFQQNMFQQPQQFRQPWSPQNVPQSQMVQFPPQSSGMDGSQPNFIDGSQPNFNRDVRFEDEATPAINTEEAESFFTLLAETDENKCISRLVCEMGADPLSAGELGTTISEIIGSLTDFPSGSKVSEYNQVLQRGRSHGMNACASDYSTCDQESYDLMKSSSQDGEADNQ